MVKENTHLYAANKIAGMIENTEISSVIEEHISCYYLGSVIPDCFYYSPRKRVNAVADILHGKKGENTVILILDILDHARSAGNSRDLAFALGYLSHCALDIAFHPVLYYFTGNHRSEEVGRTEASYRHFHIETYLDDKWNDSFYIDTLIRTDTLKDLSFPGLASTRFGIPEKMIRTALRRQMFLNRLYRKRFVYKIVCVIQRMRLLNKAFTALFYANLETEKEPVPDRFRIRNVVTGKREKTSWDETLEKASRNAVRMAGSAYDYYSGKIGRDECTRTLKGESLATGKIRTPATDIRYTKYSDQ